MYFNSVERGGGTRYPRLDNLTVEPKKGRVLIWPSALDEDPYKMDGRTNHEAMAVERGKKYAANAWIHREFVHIMSWLYYHFLIMGSCNNHILLLF